MYDFQFKLPWPPTVNHFHMPVKMGKYARCIKSPDVKKYQTRVIRHLDKLGLTNLKIKNQILIDLILHPKTAHKYDCSNFLKAYEDALEKGGFIVNDCQIEYGSIRKGPKLQGGMLDLKIKVLNI